MRLIKYIPFIGVALLAGCNSGADYTTYRGFAQGTTYTIVANSPREFGRSIDSVFHVMDNTFSMFNAESLVSRINRNETEKTTPLFEECLDIAIEVWQNSLGYYDITVKPLVDAWGFGPGTEEEAPRVECIMEYVGMDKIRHQDGRVIKTNPKIQLDFSSVAKGFTVDKLAEMLDDAGTKDYIIEVGGEVRVKGVNAAKKRWTIGIHRTTEGLSQKYETVVQFARDKCSIATSGNYRNWFVDQHGRKRVHTINPKTGMPAISDLMSVSIIMKECALADALATAVMASGSIEIAKEIVDKYKSAEYFIVYYGEDGNKTILKSPEFPSM